MQAFFIGKDMVFFKVANGFFDFIISVDIEAAYPYSSDRISLKFIFEMRTGASDPLESNI
jgi:hypothetical protein